MSYDIEDLLDIDVDSIEWIQIINGQRPWTDLFNKNNIIKFLEEMNEKFCEDHNLCKVCRSELIEVKEDRVEHFGFPATEIIWVCPNGD